METLKSWEETEEEEKASTSQEYDVLLKPNLLDLSDDVLLYVLKHCHPQDLKALGFTCSRLGTLIRDRTLWCRVDARANPVGQNRFTWFLAHGLYPGTQSLSVSGYAEDAKGCLGHINRKRPFKFPKKAKSNIETEPSTSKQKNLAVPSTSESKIENIHIKNDNVPNKRKKYSSEASGSKLNMNYIKTFCKSSDSRSFADKVANIPDLITVKRFSSKDGSQSSKEELNVSNNERNISKSELLESTNSSAEPPSSSAEPLSSSDEPKSSSDEPKSTKDKPPSSSDEPKSSSDEPKSSSDEPKSTKDEPRSLRDEANSSRDEPKSSRDEANSSGDKPKNCRDVYNSGDDSNDSTDESSNNPPYLSRQPARLFIRHNNFQQLPRFSTSPCWYDEGNEGSDSDISDKNGCKGPKWTLNKELIHSLSETCPKLTELRLEYCNINCSNTALSQFPKELKVLSLRGSKCYNSPLDKNYMFQIQEHLPLLEEVDVSECSWLEPATLMPLSKLPQLRSLRARSCRRLSECVAYASLATRYGFRKLQLLDLRETPLGDSEVMSLGWLPELEELYLAPAPVQQDTPAHAHYTDDPVTEHRELDDWELQEPEYFKNLLKYAKRMNAKNCIADLDTADSPKKLSSLEEYQNKMALYFYERELDRQLHRSQASTDLFNDLNNPGPSNRANVEFYEDREEIIDGREEKTEEVKDSDDNTQNRKRSNSQDEESARNKEFKRNIEDGNEERLAPSNPVMEDDNMDNKNVENNNEVRDDSENFSPTKVKRARFSDLGETSKSNKNNHKDLQMDEDSSDDNESDNVPNNSVSLAVNRQNNTVNVRNYAFNVNSFANLHNNVHDSVNAQNDEVNNDHRPANVQNNDVQIENNVNRLINVENNALDAHNNEVNGENNDNRPINNLLENGHDHDDDEQNQENPPQQNVICFRRNQRPVLWQRQANDEIANPENGNPVNIQVQHADQVNNDLNAVNIENDREGRVHVIYVNVRRPRNEVYRMQLENERPGIPRVVGAWDRHINEGAEEMRNDRAQLYRLMRMPSMQRIMTCHSRPSFHIDGSSLVTDASICRFGRSEARNASNYVHIGPNGAILPGLPPFDRLPTSDRPNKSKLKVLVCVGFKGVSNTSLVHLATAAPRLQFLDLSDTKITKAGVDSFNNIRPDCKVVYTEK